MDNLKPLTKPTKIPLVQKFRGASLTRFAAEAMLNGAEIMSEGEVDRGENVNLYRGSTLITIDLGERFIWGGDANLETLVAAARRSLLMRIGLMRLARRESERRCAPFLIREMEAETEFRVDAERLLIDIDVECQLAEIEEMEDEG